MAEELLRQKVELLQKCFLAIAELYPEGAVNWAEQQAKYKERLENLMASVSRQAIDRTPYADYRELLKKLYLLWRKEIIPGYTRYVAAKVNQVKEAFDGELPSPEEAAGEAGRT